MIVCQSCSMSSAPHVNLIWDLNKSKCLIHQPDGLILSRTRDIAGRQRGLAVSVIFLSPHRAILRILIRLSATTTRRRPSAAWTRTVSATFILPSPSLVHASLPPPARHLVSAVVAISRPATTARTPRSTKSSAVWPPKPPARSSFVAITVTSLHPTPKRARSGRSRAHRQGGRPRWPTLRYLSCPPPPTAAADSSRRRSGSRSSGTSPTLGPVASDRSGSDRHESRDASSCWRD